MVRRYREAFRAVKNSLPTGSSESTQEEDIVETILFSFLFSRKYKSPDMYTTQLPISLDRLILSNHNQAFSFMQPFLSSICSFMLVYGVDLRGWSCGVGDSCGRLGFSWVGWLWVRDRGKVKSQLPERVLTPQERLCGRLFEQVKMRI